MAWTLVPGVKNGTLAIFGGFRWQVNSQDVALNKSNITIQMYAGRSTSGGGTWNTDPETSYIEFDGGNRQNITTKYDFRNATVGVTYYVGTDTSVFASGAVYTFDVTHNADGSRTVPIKTFFNGNNAPYLIDITTIATITLPTIARASQPRLDAPSKEFGQSFTIYTDRASTDFTHTVKFAFGAQNGTIATGVTDSTVWITPTYLAAQIPSNNSGVGTITLETYSGTTLIGTKTIAFTLTVPTSWRAVLTTAHSGFSWVNSPAQLTGYVIQNISTLTLSLVAALNDLVSAYGTTITGYQVRFSTYDSGEVAYNNSAVTNSPGLININGVYYAYYKIKDARGNWSNEVQEQIAGTGSTIYAYGAPANTGFNVARNATPTIADFQMNFARSSVNNANTWSYQRQYWNGSSWVNIDVSVVPISTDTITSTLTHSLPYVENLVYQVRVKLTDLFSTVYYEDTLPTSAVPFVMSATGAGAGKIPTNTVYDFEVGVRGLGSDGPVKGTQLQSSIASGTPPLTVVSPTLVPNLNVEKVGGSTLTQVITTAVAAALLAAYPVGSIYISVSPTNPGTLFGGTWTTFSNGRALVGWFSADTDFDTAEKYGGEKAHTLTVAEIPGSNVNIYTGATGGSLSGGALTYAGGRSGSAYGTISYGGGAHNNMPPYMVVYMWKRTA